jgi:hypothetical protein
LVRVGDQKLDRSVKLPDSGPPGRSGSLAGVDRSTRTSRRLVVAMVAWALFVWSTRINNAWSDHTASLASKWGATLLSASFIAFAVAGIVVWVRARGRGWRPSEVVVLRAFAAWTTAVWLVFGTLILVHNHPIAFKAVHVTLGLISIGLSVALWRSTESVAVEPAPVG